MVAPADYDRLASTYDDVRGGPPFMDAWARRIAAALALRHGTRVLDVGTGTGNYALRLERFAGARVVGLDLSGAMVAKARAKAPRVAFVRGTALRLPFPDARFEGALAVFLLHHLADWRGALRDVARVLAPGGRLAILTRSHDQLRQSVMARFPGVLDIDLARFPEVAELEAAVGRLFRVVDRQILDKGPNPTSVEEWVRRARADFISTLSLLPAHERERGLAEFERRLRARGSTIDDRSTFTLLAAQK